MATYTGSVTLISAGSALIEAVGSGQPATWEVKTHYTAQNINPDLKVVLKIGSDSFVIAPGDSSSLHKAVGSQVTYECTFLAGVSLTLNWEATVLSDPKA